MAILVVAGVAAEGALAAQSSPKQQARAEERLQRLVREGKQRRSQRQKTGKPDSRNTSQTARCLGTISRIPKATVLIVRADDQVRNVFWTITINQQTSITDSKGRNLAGQLKPGMFLYAEGSPTFPQSRQAPKMVATMIRVNSYARRAR